jgi:hypothetical protein
MITLLRLCSGQGNESEDHQEHEGGQRQVGFAIVCDVIKKARAFFCSWKGELIEREGDRVDHLPCLFVVPKGTINLLCC